VVVDERRWSGGCCGLLHCKGSFPWLVESAAVDIAGKL
jgi:hypothetical protein